MRLDAATTANEQQAAALDQRPVEIDCFSGALSSEQRVFLIQRPFGCVIARGRSIVAADLVDGAWGEADRVEWVKPDLGAGGVSRIAFS